jgi:hypothetical protein
MNLTELSKDAEAFETEQWAAEAILHVELMTNIVVDPCCGRGMLARQAAKAGHRVVAFDKIDWAEELGRAAMRYHGARGDFFDDANPCLHMVRDNTVFMNPPFSMACQFVDRAKQLGARKIICFQRHAWRESVDARRAWWDKNPTARTWVCGARANCWRFDLLECQHPEGTGSCAEFKRKGKKKAPGTGCSKCMGGAPTAHSWYVWERGHKGAEIGGAIYPLQQGCFT